MGLHRGTRPDHQKILDRGPAFHQLSGLELCGFDIVHSFYPYSGVLFVYPT
jgi:hypothetical protein